MNSFFLSVKAEMIKQYKILLNSKSATVLMTLYPLLEFTALYYCYLPFKDTKLNNNLMSKIGSLNYFSFFLIGYIGLMLFQSVTLSGWVFTRERVMGTLELAYMSPASKIGLLTGNSLVGIFKNAWMSIILAILMVAFLPIDIKIELKTILVVTPIFIIPSICWGIFINSMLMFFRNSSTILSLFLTPLGLLSGTEMPISVFPPIIKKVTLLIPLTWSLLLIRGIIYKNISNKLIITYTLVLISLCIILIIFSYLICSKAEKYLKSNGSVTFF